MNERKFSYPKTFLLGFGFFGVSIIWAIYNAFVPLMLDGRYGLSAGWIGFFMVLDNIAAVLIQPAVGAWSDRLRTRLGRRLPFILVGAPIGAITFGLIPVSASLPLFVLTCATLLVSMAFWRTPVIALMPDVTPSKYRSQANGIINFMGGLASVLSFAVGSALYAKNPDYPFWMGSGLVIISAALVLIFIREPKIVDDDEKKENNQQSIWESIKAVFTSDEKSAKRILLAILFWFLSWYALETFFTLYAVKHLGMTESNAAFQLTYVSIIFLIFAIPSGYIAAKFGRRRTIMTGITIMTICVALMFFIPSDTLTSEIAMVTSTGGLYPVSLILLVTGFAWALININSLPMVVDMTTDENVGTYTGLYYFMSQTAAIIGPIVFGGVVDIFGNNYNLMMLLSPIFLVCAWFMMLGVKRGEAKTE
jgi:MFS family permease